MSQREDPDEAARRNLIRKAANESALGGLRIDPEALAKLDPKERELVAEELRVVEEAFRRNPLLGYRPHPKQVTFHSPPFPPLRAFFGGNRSHVGSTLVRMADGSTKEIDKVRVGERVVGADADGNCHPVEVLDVFCNGFAPCERFTFGRGGTEISVTATPEHRILGRYRNRPSTVRHLGEMGESWACVRGLGFEPECAGEREEWALVLGLLLGDGSYTNRGAGGRNVAFHNTEPEMMALMAEECATVGLRMSKRGAGTMSLVPERRTPKGWFQDFAADELGLACHAHEKTIPDFVTSWSNKAVGRLLAGLFLTDGWVDADGRGVGIQLTSRRMVEQIRDLLEVRFGVYGRELVKREYAVDTQRDGWTLRITSLPCVRRFAKAVPMTGRKRDRLNLAPEPMAYEKDKRNLRFLGSAPVGDQLVWDLHVDHPDNMFVLANGLVTHNSGKTTAAIVDTIIQCIDADAVPEHLLAFKRWHAPFHGRVVTPDLTSTLDGVIHEKIRDYCPPAQLKGGNFDRAFDKVQRMLRFKNGSWIQFNSSEQDREKLGGVALHRVVYDEEPRQDVRNECLTRLIDFDGEEIFALTPFSGMKWLFDEIYEPWERGALDEADGRVVVVDMDDNPHLSETGKARALKQYSGPEREARKSGRFVSFAGLIYPQFSHERHVIPAIDRVPPGVEVFRGIDPGYRHLCAVLYAYLDSDDELVIFDEIGLKGATVKDVCAEMQRRDLRWGEERGNDVFPLRVNWTVIDPASKNKNNQTGRSDQQEFWDNGVSTVPGQNAVGAGINRVKERLDADKFKVCANCVGLIGEFRRYRWVMDTGRGENEAREAPVKKDDHYLDDARYIVMQRPLAPKEKIPEESMTSKQRLLRHHLKKLRRPQSANSGFGPGQWA